VPIVVDPDRVRGAATAVRETGATHLLLDDGFQHWRLARDLDIVVVEAADPLCARRPRREHPHALARADAVVLSRTADRSEALAAMAVLGPYAPNATFVATTLKGRKLHLGGEERPPDALKGRSVLAMAGIASPEGFIHTLGDLGAIVVEMRFYSDHHRYSRRELEGVLAEAGAAGTLVVTTAKDIVKVPPDLATRLAWLEVEAVPMELPMMGNFEELLRPVLSSGTVESS
jgi:tetraacyldisaccharide 4'-kinase